MSESIFWSVYDQGCDHLDAGRLDAAVECFAASLNAAKLAQSQDLMVMGAIELAVAYRAKEQLEIAQRTLDLAITLAARLGSRRLLGRAYLELATLHMDRGDLDAARAAQLAGIAELEPAVAEIEAMARGTEEQKAEAAELVQMLEASREQLAAIQHLSQQ